METTHYMMHYEKVYRRQVNGIHYVIAYMIGTSWVGTIMMILLPRYGWFNPDTGSGIFGEFNAMRGLWWTCGVVSDMNFLCYNIATSMFEIPTETLLMQVMMSLAFVAETIACLMVPLAADWSRALEQKPGLKINLMRAIGFLMVFSGLLIFATCLWYGIILQREYFFPGNADQTMVINNDQIHYEYGACLYMGFFLALLNFIIAIVCFMSPGGVDVEKAEEDVLENYIKRDEDEKKMEQMNPMLNYSHIQPKLNNYEAGLQQTANMHRSVSRRSQSTSIVDNYIKLPEYV